jgi:hypothetical protein
MPEYLHPSVHSRIIDNSFVFQTAAGTTVLFACGKAVKGPDNILTRLTTKDEAKFIFGEPNMPITGQSMYNVYNWLGAGGEAYFIRVLPGDAEYSNIVLSLGLDNVNGSKTVVPLISNVGSKNTVGTSAASLEAMETLVNTAPDMANTSAMTDVLGTGHPVPSTTKVYPLAVFYPYGRGKAYNKMGIRLSVKDGLDNTYDFRTYGLEITAKDITGADVVVDGPYTVSFEKTAKDRSRESLFFANVLNKYSKFLKVAIADEYEDRMEEVRSFIIDFDMGVDGTAGHDPDISGVNPLHLDVFFGKERSGVQVYASGQGTASPSFTAAAIHHNQGVKFATPKVNNVDVPNPEDYQDNWKTLSFAPDLSDVCYLMGGHDGTWGPVYDKSADPTGANPALWVQIADFSEESLLNKAYKAEIDSVILDKKQYLFDVLLDGNNPASVKNAMSEFADVMREDCVAILDCGFQATAQQTIDFRHGSISMSNFRTAIFGQDAVVYDEYTGQNIKVTMTYFLAKKIPANDEQFGVQWSFTGPRRGTISGFDQINFFPNEMWKESLYKAQVNYVEKDPKRINFGTQLTAQTVNSALSNINNVRALMRIKRDVEAMMDEYRDEFNDAITHESMSYNLNSYLQKWVSNRTCKTISGAVYASDYDRQQKIARVRVDMIFTGLIERIFIDFVVNR